MRLICPNCGARYEVPDEVIPENGRDVQCSNCGDTWFQTHPDHPFVPEAEPDQNHVPEEQPDWTEEENSGPEPEDEYQYEPEQKTEEEETETATRRGIDPDVASVLREEADREQQARKADARGGLETQPDLGLMPADEETDRRRHQARLRMARLRGMPTDAAEAEADSGLDRDDLDSGSRRTLLPDIDDIKSTITEDASTQKRDRSARDGSKNAPKPAGKSGFRTGLRLSIILALIGVAAYIFAPQISNAVPALAEPLSGYVNAVNQIRLLVNDQIAGLVAQVQALIGG